MMIRASAQYSTSEKTQQVFQIPASTSLNDAIQQSKQLSNEYLTSILDLSIEGEPYKLKKTEDSEGSLEA